MITNRCRDPYETLKQTSDLGIHSILTSGQQQTPIDSADLLAELISYNLVDIMPGSGVYADMIKQLWLITRATSYHLSGKKIEDSPMTYRNDNVNMGLPSLNEFEIWRTDKKKIAEAIQVLLEIMNSN